jgi:hypothetical protein
MARARRVRVLIYEGPEEWVTATTESASRYVGGKRVISYSAPEHLPYDVRPVNELPTPNCTITEHLSEMEKI